MGEERGLETVLGQGSEKGMEREWGLELAEWLNRLIADLCFPRKMRVQLKSTREGSQMKSYAT